MLLAKEFAVALEVSAEHAEAFGEIGFGQQFTRAEQMGRAAKNPRIVERAATDAHAGTTGFVEHVFRGDRRRDVAVADDGDGFHRLHDRPDASEIDATGEALRAGAAVNEDRGDADAFEHAREFGRGEIVFVPAEAHFGGDGNFYGVDHATHEGGSFIELGHHGGSATDLRHLFYGTTHVDVDGLGSQFLAHHGGVTHFLGHAAEELDGHGVILRRGRDELERGGVAFEKRVGVDEIRGGPTESAEFAHRNAHGQVGVARKWREKEIRRKFVGSEAHGQRLRDEGREQRNPFTAVAAIDFKIVVDGDDAALRVQLTQANEAGVGVIHPLGKFPAQRAQV